MRKMILTDSNLHRPTEWHDLNIALTFTVAHRDFRQNNFAMLAGQRRRFAYVQEMQCKGMHDVLSMLGSNS